MQPSEPTAVGEGAESPAAQPRGDIIPDPPNPRGKPTEPTAATFCECPPETPASYIGGAPGGVYCDECSKPVRPKASVASEHLPDPSHRDYRGMPKRFRKDDVTRCVKCGEPWPCQASTAAYMSNAPGLDLLRTQMQETGSIATGVGFPLPWLLLFLSDLGIDENAVYIDVANGRIEVKP